MNKLLTSAALTGAALTFALPAAAQADVSHGFLRSFENGKLTVFNRTLGKTVYIINSKTDCGVSFGQSGDSIPCKTLGSSEYASHKVFIRWTRNDANKRVAKSVGVDMSNG